MSIKFSNFCIELDNLVSIKEASIGIKKIEEYIENNFISMKEENKLKKYMNIFHSFLEDELQNKKEQNFKNLSKSQILELFVQNDKIDEDLFGYYLDNFIDSFEDEDRNCFEYILKSKKYTNDNKYHALFALKNAEITDSVIVYNYFLKRYDVISLKKWGSFSENEYYKSVLDKINKLFFKTPSLIDTTFQILFNIYIAYLGAPSKYSPTKLANNLHKMITETVEGKKNSNQEFENFIVYILQLKEEINN